MKKRPQGCPRTTVPTDCSLEELGQEMLAWVKENNPLHLSYWYTIEKGIIYNDWKDLINKKAFIPYYEQALRIVTKNYLNGNINSSIAQRFLRIYFNDLREQEDADLDDKSRRETQTRIDTLKEEYKLKAEAINAIAPDITSRFDAIMNQLSNTQKQDS